jgi:TMEM175 potassium channel family protein
VTDDRTPESQRRELDRIGAFSDGVFAVAVTLLVLNIEVPDLPDGLTGREFADSLDGLLPLVQAYFIAFAVIGLFWYGHHRAWSRYERSSPRLVVVNLLLLALIGLMPFTTNLLGQYGDQPLATAIYAFNVGLAAIADSWMDRVAIRDELAPPFTDREAAETRVAGWLRPAIFFLSIPVAWLSVTVAQLMWLGLFAVQPLARRMDSGPHLQDGG